jgi:toxin HigB-1
VLRSFGDKDTHAIWERRRSRKLDAVTQRAALRKLTMLEAAETLADLLVPPGNRLEKLSGDNRLEKLSGDNRLERLSGDRAGQHSIRINRQWRVCFRWSDAGPEDVAIVDYH